MGVDQNIYLGPYASVLIPVMIKTVDPCIDHDVKPGDKFCPTCGKPTNNRAKEERVHAFCVESLTNYDMLDIERISLPDIERLGGLFYEKTRAVPNLIDFGLNRKTDIENSDIDEVNILELNIKQEIQIFEERFGTHLAKMREKGAIVETKWGLLHYYS